MEEFKSLILEMKAAGMVVDSYSPWCSPVSLVKKKDGSIRICVDFRKLNAVTIKDAYPVPIISDLFNQLAKAKVFSTIDLKAGFYQLKMHPDSEQYTAFATHFGFFNYKRMPMGLTNAGATFQRMMDAVLKDYLGKICLVYLDDIIIYSSNETEHLDHIRMVAECMRQNNLKIALKKCKFFQKRIEYLSHVIEDGKISPNPARYDVIAKLQTPKNVKQIQSFLGFASYYRKFIKSFATIASPLTQLTEKGNDFVWSNECQAAFDKLKQTLISDQVLILPDFQQPFRIETDASGYGIGGVLSQKRGQYWKPVAYFSRHLNRVERRYSASEKEMLAIANTVEYFKQYIYGRHIEIYTDHCNTY